MDIWVRIPSNDPVNNQEDAARSYYYWNSETNEVLWDLPEGESASWALARTCSGTYYWHLASRRASWDVPTSAGTEFGVSAGLSRPGQVVAPPPEGGWQFTCVLPIEEQPETPNERARSSTAAPGGRQQTRGGAEDWGGCEEWVEVRLLDLACEPYFWDFRQGASVRTLPPGVRAQWRAFESPDGGPFYYVSVETGETFWRIPGMPLDDREEGMRSELHIWRWLAVGAAIMVKGLTSDERYNGQMGQVEGFQDGRVVVKLPDCLAAPRLAARPANLEALRPTTIVQVKGLRSRPEFNNEIATVVDVDPHASRYTVKLSHMDKELSMRPEHVLAKGGLWESSFRLDHNCSYLQWRKEQTCLFIDSSRQHHKFSLSLPLSFATYQQEATSENEVSAWPMIVYLHGTGGSGFFCHSRKSLKSVGLQYAASKFVVVSPHCEWNWRETPLPWVTEMVKELRAAAWCDVNRIYLTGCSMGGMSTWELGAASPELYAAIAPVAGHHKPERGPFLAERLAQTPVCVVHSSADETCPIRIENPLWEGLKNLGNRRIEVHVSSTIDHCSMYERTYCDTCTIYDWLLRFRRPE
mmetsp:Transcript_28894/g.76348  ORF Transcript_28894/g.76348 Transcript_28894/m.76348 type:complete len:582 (+) Transcript_28894:109-1854(+)